MDLQENRTQLRAYVEALAPVRINGATEWPFFDDAKAIESGCWKDTEPLPDDVFDMLKLLGLTPIKSTYGEAARRLQRFRLARQADGCDVFEPMMPGDYWPMYAVPASVCVDPSRWDAS